jgi:hypothetical protein
MVTIEWSYSDGTTLLAFADYIAGECKSGDIEVRTYDFSGGPAVLSDNVGYYLYIN